MQLLLAAASPAALPAAAVVALVAPPLAAPALAPPALAPLALAPPPLVPPPLAPPPLAAPATPATPEAPGALIVVVALTKSKIPMEKRMTKGGGIWNKKTTQVKRRMAQQSRVPEAKPSE